MMQSSRSRRCRTRRIAVPSLAVAVAMGLTACGSGGSTVKTDDDGVRHVSVVVGAYPVLESSVPWIVGTAKGTFAEHGVEVDEIIGSAGGSSDIRNALAAEVPLASVGTLAAAEAAQSGIEVTAVAAPSRNLAGTYLVASQKSGLKTLDDVRGSDGLRWGYTNPKSVTESLAYLAMDEFGLAEGEQVEMVSSGGSGEAVTLLSSGDLDLAFIPATLYVGSEQRFGAMLGTASEIVPDYSWELLVTTPAILDENRDVIKDLLQGYAAAVEYIEQDPAEAGKLWAEAAEIDPDVAVEVLEVAVAAGAFGTGGLDDNGWLAVEDSLDRAGVKQTTTATLFAADFMQDVGFELPARLR
ncbi:ABC transporter substrate-binding protein [Nocardioides soli]|uniref:ABC-type nitrate/sulfonate/bicarbonate transport system substrate-binding protein n=1 Tax=Nocardioides soli TaxID=1036020 RepID=A0A7W4Z372_9ACTN|nr:ABC transporter substrate-binding protein [Nocardioides soli]MBB3044763.1 ABC-type nitrate/sulfonate/bicarbonate transport system substrate-binding protein [Nocardioides soli]